jgi:hypothetical protein
MASQNECYSALAAGILNKAIEDINKKKYREECIIFFKSDWCNTLCALANMNPDVIRKYVDIIEDEVRERGNSDMKNYKRFLIPGGKQYHALLRSKQSRRSFKTVTLAEEYAAAWKERYHKRLLAEKETNKEHKP